MVRAATRASSPGGGAAPKRRVCRAVGGVPAGDGPARQADEAAAATGFRPAMGRKSVDGRDAIELASAWGGKTYREEGFDTIVLVYASTAQCELYDQLKAEGAVKELYLAGAAWLPRHMAESTRHGANIGLVI